MPFGNFKSILSTNKLCDCKFTIISLGVNFTNILISKEKKNSQASHQCTYALFGSVHVKAACKLLTKLTLGWRNLINLQLIEFESCDLLLQNTLSRRLILSFHQICGNSDKGPSNCTAQPCSLTVLAYKVRLADKHKNK